MIIYLHTICLCCGHLLCIFKVTSTCLNFLTKSIYPHISISQPEPNPARSRASTAVLLSSGNTPRVLTARNQAENMPIEHDSFQYRPGTKTTSTRPAKTRHSIAGQGQNSVHSSHRRPTTRLEIRNSVSVECKHLLSVPPLQLDLTLPRASRSDVVSARHLFESSNMMSERMVSECSINNMATLDHFNNIISSNSGPMSVAGLSSSLLGSQMARASLASHSMMSSVMSPLTNRSQKLGKSTALRSLSTVNTEHSREESPVLSLRSSNLAIRPFTVLESTKKAALLSLGQSGEIRHRVWISVSCVYCSLFYLYNLRGLCLICTF